MSQDALVLKEKDTDVVVTEDTKDTISKISVNIGWSEPTTQIAIDALRDLLDAIKIRTKK